MIRNRYTNKQLYKVSKYRKFLLLRAYHLIVLTSLYTVICFRAIRLIGQNQLHGLAYFLGFSFMIYFIFMIQNRAFYGVATPVKLYQEKILKALGNKKSYYSVFAIFDTLFYTVLVYFIISNSIYACAVFALVSFVLQLALIDINDLHKIKKTAAKLAVDISDYRLFDNDLFSSMTREQIFYVYAIREELVAFISLDKKLTEKKLVDKIEEEEYMLVTMLTRQMEKLGK